MHLTFQWKTAIRFRFPFQSQSSHQSGTVEFNNSSVSAWTPIYQRSALATYTTGMAWYSQNVNQTRYKLQCNRKYPWMHRLDMHSILQTASVRLGICYCCCSFNSLLKWKFTMYFPFTRCLHIRTSNFTFKQLPNQIKCVFYLWFSKLYRLFNYHRLYLHCCALRWTLHIYAMRSE